MGLNPKYLESLPNTLVDMYGLVEIDILADMARRISTYDYFIPAAQHQMQKLRELGGIREEIIKKLAAMTGKTQAEIVALLAEAGEQAVVDDLEHYKAAEVYEPSRVNTEALYKQLNSGLLQTQQSFSNITRTTANTATKQFERALDWAWTQINTGGFDMTTAIRRAITGLAEAGVGSIEYKSGRIDNIEVAVRRAVVTGANQTAAKTQEVLADELGVDLVEVTAHGGARPEHAKWQGRVFSRNGRKKIDGVVYEDLRKATGYGKAGGLCGINCRHNFHPYIPGASRTWSDKELAKLEEKNVEYNGVKYTEYEASQIQRKIEREIRKQKRTVAALEAGGQDASKYRSKLREAQKTYTDFTKQTGLKKQSARTQVGVVTAKPKTGQSATDETAAPGIPAHKGTVDFADKKSVIRQLETGEKEVAALDYEVNYTVTTDGKVWRVEGEASTVNSSAIPSSLKGSYSYHNHPKSKTHYSFGSSDVATFIETEAAYAKASDDLFEYVMRRTEKTIAKPWDEVYHRFKEIQDTDVFYMMWDKIIDPDLDAYHAAVKILCEELGIEYERKKKGE